MIDLLTEIWRNYTHFLSARASTAAAALRDQKRADFLKELGLILAAICAPVIVAVLLLLVAYRWRKVLLLLVMVPFLFKSYQVNHPKKFNEASTGGIVDEELARERARELYPAVRAWMFRVLSAVAAFTVIDRKRDVLEIETAGAHFFMNGSVAVFQFEVDSENELAPEQVDFLRDKFQEYGRKFISEYPMLVSPDAAGRSPMEVLAVHPLGRRICIDVVQTTAASIPMIEARRRARAERKHAPAQSTRYVDPDYGDE